MAHLVIAAGLWPLALSIWWKLALTLLLAASAVFYVRRDALLAAADSIVAVEVEADRTCGVQLKSSEWRECVLLDTSFVSPYFTILNLKPKNAWFARHVVILPDSLSKDEFRRSRVWLRWKCAKSRIKDSGVRI